MLKIIKQVQKIIVYALLLMLLFVVAISTFEVGLHLVRQLFQPPYFMLDVNKLLELFGLFMMVIIGLELLHSIKSYTINEQIPVEEVFMAAMIALARKVIVLDIKSADALLLAGLGVLIIALTTGYYLVKKSTLFVPNKTEG